MRDPMKHVYKLTEVVQSVPRCTNRGVHGRLCQH